LLILIHLGLMHGATLEPGNAVQPDTTGTGRVN